MTRSDQVSVPAVQIEHQAIARRTLRVLVASQIFSGAGLAAGVTVGALLAEQMLGSDGLAGVPSALLTGGSAAAAVLVGALSNRSGRRWGLSFGYLSGAVGGALVVVAAALNSVTLLFVALLIYGAGTATNLQARYAGADLAPAHRRGRAISTVLVATTLGAVGGPLLVDVSGGLAASVGLPRLSGPFIIATVAYGIAAVVLLLFLRPDPLLVARAEAAASDAARSEAALSDAATPTDTIDNPGVPTDTRPPSLTATAGSRAGIITGATAMVGTQLIMVAIMTMTPVHMHDHGLGLQATGLVIAVHIGMMYLPSPISGRLADRYGSRVTILAGIASLLAAGLLAAAAPGDSTVLLAVALGLLGLGWNLGLLGGTTLVTNAVALADRARIQGRVDLGVALSGATGGLVSGVVMSSTSYTVLTLAGGVLAVALLPAALRRSTPAVTT